ncbi:MAG: pyridoxamine 5'-phosphate oxidase [Chthoniobacterales bacterium]|nr:pyridoxamine 5'-phosphate oxidase [Chthoniobacterales bacterium]MCX7713355.1 pyridoxamine 5'-phosphate oxidase [Chthoniobacterales bacterium]
MSDQIQKKNPNESPSLDADKPASEMPLSEMRRDYHRGALRRENLPNCPFTFFRQWFEEARSANIAEPNAMILSTADASGFVLSRAVLLKAYDERGFVFFTNYHSRKAEHIAQNPNVSLLFPWFDLERQVIICGKAEKISTAESIAYFMSRPFGSRIGAWVSQQSKVISTRALLETKFHELVQKFANGEVPKPDWWGGYRVCPTTIEFWQGGPNRIHDRFEYRKTPTGWEIVRLQP